MMMTRRQSLFAALAFALPGRLPAAGAGTLAGRVSYRERIALPPGAMIRVQLVDVSRADAPARVLGESSFAAQGSAPFAFRIAYDPADIRPGHSYALQARITRADRLLFINTRRHAVFGPGPDMTDILVEHVARPAP